MNTDSSKRSSWRQLLVLYSHAGLPLFGDDFLERWGEQTWLPAENDKRAAAALHTQIASRVTTQALGYSDGVDVAALESVAQLFPTTRAIGEKYFGATHFEPLVWYVLNTYVRPFTAKWHRRSQAGAFSALDSTDEFRAELGDLRPILLCFDDLLVEIRDGIRPPPAREAKSSKGAVELEMERPLPWGVSLTHGGIEKGLATQINDAERLAINARRQNYNIVPVDQPHAAGLALSGGGIRSATFSLGVMIALSRRNILPQFDYLSTVSGGGYIGSFITTYLSTASSSKPGPDVGLKASQLPFRRGDGEADALRYIRHHSKYLQTSMWERITIAAALGYGMLINCIALLLLPTIFALLEYWLRPPIDYLLSAVAGFTSVVAFLIIVVILLPLIIRLFPSLRKNADTWIAVPSSMLLGLAAWQLLGVIHEHIYLFPSPGNVNSGHLGIIVLAGAIPIVTAVAIGLAGKQYPRAHALLAILAGTAAPVFFVGVELATYEWIARETSSSLFPIQYAHRPYAVLAFTMLVFLFIFLPLDVNFTSPHRHYRRKLAEVFLIRPLASTATPTTSALDSGFDTAAALKLSQAAESGLSPYHLINAALNVPNSKNSAMQGRLTDFFLFSPAYCGSPLVGYQPTMDWEKANPVLELGTAMAISGAAASPLMGLATQSHLSFWLALLNVRLGYWLRKPAPPIGARGDAPGMSFLLKEMFGRIDEQARFLNVTDGGHIENLGVFELLRRRCKFIVAVDGEHDPSMTFHALATLQRLAAIDLGVKLDIDLDDLRLGATGLSRSHFQFCRIQYPSEDGKEKSIGYLLYLKLSLTGNEGEFIRRYRLDEPAFPHHSTANQFFTEAQFEAYRSLGEHVGDKLFLKAIVGPMASANEVVLREWFIATGRSLLTPSSSS